MPHEYLLNAIDAAATKTPQNLQNLKTMIINGRPSTSKHGLGWLVNGGIRPTELFTPLSNGDNIFHLLAKKQLIADVLPTITKAFLTPGFVQREGLQRQLGLPGKSLTPTITQIDTLLKAYLNQPDQNSKTVASLSCAADKIAITPYLPQEERLTITHSVPPTAAPAPADPNAPLQQIIKNLAQYFKNDKDALQSIKDTLGSDYNNLQLFIHLHSEFGESFADFVMDMHGTPFVSIDDFFNKLFTITPTQDFKDTTGKGMDAFSLTCHHKDHWLARKLLSWPNKPFLQKEYINKALFYDSTEALEAVVKHYKTQTDWQSILYKSIEHGRPEVLQQYFREITPLINGFATFKTLSGSKDYTAHTYILHMLRVVQDSIAKKVLSDKDTTTEQARLDRIFDCWKMIKSTVNLDTCGSILSKAINKLPEEIQDRIAEDDSELFNNIMEYAPAQSSGRSTASAAFSDRSIYEQQQKSGFLPKKGTAKHNILPTSYDDEEGEETQEGSMFRDVDSPDNLKTDSQDEVSTFNSDLENSVVNTQTEDDANEALQQVLESACQPARVGDLLERVELEQLLAATVEVIGDNGGLDS
jgi:hypothetical protein